MDWFSYDKDLCHEMVNNERIVSCLLFFFIEGVLAESDTYLGLCLTSVVERFGKIMNS